VAYAGHQYPYTITCSPTLAEDAQAILEGDESYYMDVKVPLAANIMHHGDSQDVVLPPVMNTAVIAQANSPSTIPGQSQLQHQTNVGAGINQTTIPLNG
jgi:hypothetical protein